MKLIKKPIKDLVSGDVISPYTIDGNDWKVIDFDFDIPGYVACVSVDRPNDGIYLMHIDDSFVFVKEV